MHNRSKAACRQFEMSGTCVYGDVCRFSHCVRPSTPNRMNSLPVAHDSSYNRPLKQRFRSASTSSRAGASHISPPILDYAHPTQSVSHRPWLCKHPPPHLPSDSAASLRVMSYNLLADGLAHAHKRELYSIVPPHVLHWPHRLRLILAEIAHYKPTILCLQEVEDFASIQSALEQLGYLGRHIIRTGGKFDGCALFWCASFPLSFYPVRNDLHTHQ